jgi:pimeloyl-ACP methyl ester carboxylesterase
MMTTKQTEIHYRSADDTLELYAAEQGPKEAPLTLLCLHGLTRNGRDFEGIATRLARRYRVITADQRGRGRSPWDPNPANYALGTYVADVVKLLDQLSLPRVVLIGTSMGGLMSLILAASQPQRVQGIVLNDIGPEIPAAGLKRLRESLIAPSTVVTWADAANQARRANALAFPDFDAADWDAFARRVYRTDASGDPMPGCDPAILDALSQPVDPTAVAPTLWPLWEKAAAFPILAIRGALSDILSAETLERMVASHPCLTALTLAHRGHAPMLDEPEAAQAIDEFLHQLESR